MISQLILWHKLKKRVIFRKLTAALLPFLVRVNLLLSLLFSLFSVKEFLRLRKFFWIYSLYQRSKEIFVTLISNFLVQGTLSNLPPKNYILNCTNKQTTVTYVCTLHVIGHKVKDFMGDGGDSVPHHFRVFHKLFTKKYVKYHEKIQRFCERRCLATLFLTTSVFSTNCSQKSTLNIMKKSKDFVGDGAWRQCSSPPPCTPQTAHKKVC